MKFIWNEPEMQRDQSGKPLYFPRLHWDLPVVGWLNYNGVWPEKQSRDYWEIEYNYAHHFFDIHIYECHLPHRGAPDSVIKQMREFLQANPALRSQEMGSFRWEGQKQIQGARFWIYAEDH